MNERFQYITNSADGTVLQELKWKFGVEQVRNRVSRLTIANIQLSDEGQIACKESNADHDTAMMTLIVTGTANVCKFISL